MANKISLKANDGSTVEFYDEIKAQGGVKDVYFSLDKSYVVAFYRKPINANDRERINNIVGIYRERIFDTPEGAYWKNLFAWPTKMVEWNGKTGIVMPFYDKKFFFSSGPFKGKEKEGKWFASAKLRNKFLPADQKGNWLTTLHMCIKIARAVRRLQGASGIVPAGPPRGAKVREIEERSGCPESSGRKSDLVYSMTPAEACSLPLPQAGIDRERLGSKENSPP